jgi:hypothetical protein
MLLNDTDTAVLVPAAGRLVIRPQPEKEEALWA